METNFKGELTIMKELELKPNFSQIARSHGVDRRTVAKHWKHNSYLKKVPKQRKSYFDPYFEEIERKFQITGVTKKAVYEFLKSKYGEIPSYPAFTRFLRNQNILTKVPRDAQVRYETKKGEQLQFDWKEDIVLHSKSGKKFKFNVFSATLSFSRYRVFLYSQTRTTEDVLNNLIKTLDILGGTTKTLLTDNMSSIVSIKQGRKRKHAIIKQFEKDLDIRIQLCKTRRANTKGKVESANRFLTWLLPYDCEFDTEQELIEILEEITRKTNLEVSQTTGLPPIVLFKKEKEFLKKLPNKILLESYTQEVLTQVVPQTLLVSYKNSGYSVPMQYIGKRVKILIFTNILQIYYNTRMIAEHEITTKSFHYKEEHYIEGLQSSIRKEQIDIHKIAMENLALLENFEKGGNRND